MANPKCTKRQATDKKVYFALNAWQDYEYWQAKDEKITSVNNQSILYLSQQWIPPVPKFLPPP